MSEEIVESNTQTNTEEVGNLPYGNVEQDFSGFELTEDIKSKFKDSRLNGRFGSINEVLDKLKEAEDFKANTIRDQKSAEGQADEITNQAKDDAAKVATQNTVVKELIPQFLENGMKLTPEMQTKATEAGIDIRDLKLGAIELRDATTSAHQLTDGKENYEAMRTWADGVLDAGQKASFDAALNSGMGEYAIKGLYAEFQKASDNGDVGRIEGSTVFTGVQPYADRRELFKDKQYIESPAGRRDTAAQKMYRARLGKTPDNVIYGR